MTLRALPPAACAALAVPLTAAPARAAAPGPAPLLAGYWAEFVDHWTNALQHQNGFLMAGLLLGAVCLFLITRGTWRK